MIRIKYLYIFYILLFIPGPASAQNAVYDMFQNQRYEFEDVYKEVDFEQPYFARKIEYTVQNFTGRPQPVYKKLNDDMLKMCLGYIENEARFLALHHEANARLSAFKNLKNSQNTYIENTDASHELKEVECNIKSIIANQVFYEIDFEFAIKTEGYDSNNFHIRHYYKADLLTGKISVWKPNKGLQHKKAIEDLIASQLNSTYLLLTEKLCFSELLSNGNDTPRGTSYQPEMDAKPVSNLFSRINLDEADFFWYRNGLIIQFQEYSKGNNLLEGKFFHLFFSYDEALKITRLLPDFIFLRTLPRVENNFRGWNEFESKRVLALQTEPTVFDVLQLNNYKGKTKTLQQTSKQIGSNGKSTIVSKIIYEFRSDQKLISKLTFNHGGALTDSVVYQYNTQGNIKSNTHKYDNEPPVTVAYEYDAFNNLIKRIDGGLESLITTYFFYNKNILYYFSFYPLESNEHYPVTRYELKANMFCYDQTCYETDEKGRIITVLAEKAAGRDIQIGRDSLGRIIETHFDGDRYNYYFEYDSQNRLKKFQSNEENVVFEYKNSNTYPDYIIKQNSRNNTQLDQQLEWTFY